MTKGKAGPKGSATPKKAAATSGDVAQGRRAAPARAPVWAPAWAYRALTAPARYADIAALRAKLHQTPALMTRRVIPEVVRAVPHDDDDAARFAALVVMVRCYLEHGPAALAQRNEAAREVAQKVAAVGRAADDLFAALKSLERCGAEWRARGVEPLTLPTWFPFGQAAPELESSLRDVARRAEKRGRSPGRAENYAGAAAFVVALDEALPFRLSHAAGADLWEFLSGDRITAAAIARARSRTLRG